MRYLLVLGFIFSVVTQAQERTKYGIQTQMSGFIHNNEYFNNIADGYTIIGNQIQPELKIQPHSDLEIHIGAYALYYAGAEKYNKILPTFQLKYRQNKSVFEMGTLSNPNAHNVLPMMLNPESLLDERQVEYGIQWTYKHVKLPVNLWLNWETMIEQGDANHEEFVVGLNTSYQWVAKNKWTITTPLQNLFYHHGGQVNTDLVAPRYTYTIRNTAIGLDIEYNTSNKLTLQWEGFYLQYANSSKETHPFYEGQALYSMLHANYKNWHAGVGYWNGNSFISPRGEDIFQSYSRRTDIHYENGILQPVYNGHTEKERSLWLAQLSYQKELIPHLNFHIYSHAFFQPYESYPENDPEHIVNQRFDYNIGLKLTYQGFLSLK
jgi:hypothetical protein